jgi:small subunit ribosomal protein S6
MRDYELMTIHRPELAESDIESKVGELESALSSAGCSVTGRDVWGKRRFAYEIDHITEGYYTVVNFQGGPDAVHTVDRMLTLSDEIVRHKIVGKNN